MSKIKPEVQAIIDRCARIDWRTPPIDEAKIKDAYTRRLHATGLKRSIRCFGEPSGDGARGARDAWAWDARDASAAWDAWVTWAAWDARAARAARAAWAARDARDAWAARAARDARDAWAAWDARAAWAARDARDAWAAWAARAARDARDARDARAAWAAWDVRAAWDARDARDASGWLNSSSKDKDVQHLREVYAPMIDAFEAGSFAHILSEHEVLVLTNPAIHTRNNVLHRLDGPAIEWPETKLWFWKGTNIPKNMIEKRHKMTADEVLKERNAEFRRIRMDIYAEVNGPTRLLTDTGAKLMAEDEQHGRPRKLYDIKGVRFVHVVNGSMEPDGTRREFLLGAHPQAKTPHEAVAASYARPAGKFREALRT